jgi:hypothetical protein
MKHEGPGGCRGDFPSERHGFVPPSVHFTVSGPLTAPASRTLFSFFTPIMMKIQVSVRLS